jgi:hypothetical protein
MPQPEELTEALRITPQPEELTEALRITLLLHHDRGHDPQPGACLRLEARP